MSDPRECYGCIHHDVCMLRISVDEFLSGRLNPFNWTTSDANAKGMIVAQHSLTQYCELYVEKEKQSE